jgi:integrase
MPPPRKPPRLWLRPARPGRAAAYFIVDANRQIGTGTADPDQAGQVLASYIREKHGNVKRETDCIWIAEVIKRYAEDVAHDHARPHQTKARLLRVLEFFGEKSLSELNGALCRAYARSCPTPAAARRDLEDLRAAINHHRREGLHDRLVSVVLPAKSLPRERWLTRGEVAALLWRCWRRGKSKHLARFIIISVYTGRRMSVVLGASFRKEPGRTWLDTKAGMLWPPERAKQTKKRNPAIPLPGRLLAHLRRWERMGATIPVEYGGANPDRCRALSRAAREAGLGDDVSPHTLRHTAASWLVQNGADMYKASRYLGMSVPTLERVYAHHGVEHLRDAADLLTRK